MYMYIKIYRRIETIANLFISLFSLIILLYKLFYFVFYLQVYFCFFKNIPANFIIGFWGLKFALNNQWINLGIIIIM
jgi:hypothetical protein